MKTLISWLFAIVLSQPLLAENNRNRNNQPVGPPKNYGLEIFDDKVFDSVGKSGRGEETTESKRSGKTRYVDGAFDYNVEELRPTICEPQKGTSGYSKCVKDERKRSRNELQLQQDRIEKRQNTPLQTAPRLPSAGDL